MGSRFAQPGTGVLPAPRVGTGGTFSCRAATLDCVRLAAAFLAGGSHGQRHGRPTRPSPPGGLEGSPGRGWPLTPPLIPARESEESGSKLHALQIGLGEN